MLGNNKIYLVLVVYERTKMKLVLLIDAHRQSTVAQPLKINIKLST